MRLYELTLTARLEGSDPKLESHLDVEEFTPRVVIETIPNALRNLADQLAEQLAAQGLNPIPDSERRK